MLKWQMTRLQRELKTLLWDRLLKLSFCFQWKKKKHSKFIIHLVNVSAVPYPLMTGNEARSYFLWYAVRDVKLFVVSSCWLTTLQDLWFFPSDFLFPGVVSAFFLDSVFFFSITLSTSNEYFHPLNFLNEAFTIWSNHIISAPLINFPNIAVHVCSWSQFRVNEWLANGKGGPTLCLLYFLLTCNRCTGRFPASRWLAELIKHNKPSMVTSVKQTFTLKDSITMFTYDWAHNYCKVPHTQLHIVSTKWISHTPYSPVQIGTIIGRRVSKIHRSYAKKSGKSYEWHRPSTLTVTGKEWTCT